MKLKNVGLQLAALFKNSQLQLLIAQISDPGDEYLDLLVSQSTIYYQEYII